MLTLWTVNFEVVCKSLCYNFWFMIVIVSDTISADRENKQEGGKTEEIWKTGQITAPIVWPTIKAHLLLNKLLSSSSDQNLLFLKHLTSCSNTKFINLNKDFFVTWNVFFYLLSYFKFKRCFIAERTRCVCDTNAPDNGQFQLWPRSQGQLFLYQ